MTIDQSQLNPRQREDYHPPYERHAWEPQGPGLLSLDRCGKCGKLTTSPGGVRGRPGLHRGPDRGLEILNRVVGRCPPVLLVGFDADT